MPQSPRVTATEWPAADLKFVASPEKKQTASNICVT